MNNKIRYGVVLVWALMIWGTMGSCSRSNSQSASQTLTTERDSVAYILGMNIGQRLMEMDTLLNIEAVCAGIREQVTQNERFDKQEARRIYLHYFQISKAEEVVAYEEQFLEEFAEDNRSYARSKTGLTYAVEQVGDVEQTPRMNNDTVSIRFLVRNLEGKEFYSSYERGDTLRTTLGTLPDGLQEALKLVGTGGRLKAYLPAKLGYGAEGCDSLGIGANTTLYYEVDLLEVKRRVAASRRGR